MAIALTGLGLSTILTIVFNTLKQKTQLQKWDDLTTFAGLCVVIMMVTVIAIIVE